MTDRPHSLRIRVIGPLDVNVDGRRLAAPSNRRAWVLLGFLALWPGAHPRSSVAARIWPDVLDDSARASLRTAFWALRRALGPAGSDRLIATRETVGLVDDELLWVDHREFTDAVAAGHAERAIALCRGPLLEGVDDSWAILERELHEDATGDVLGALTGAALADGATTIAVRWARRRVAHRPLSEAATRSLMDALAAAGEPAEALEAHRRLTSRLRREFGIAAGPATRRLAERIREAAERERRPTGAPRGSG